MKRKGILLALAALTCFCVGTAAACKKDKDYTGFQEGCATEIMIGDTMRLEEVINVEEGTKYTLTVSNGDETIDLSDKNTWVPKTMGEWTLTLEILSGDNKGTYTWDIYVNIPFASMTYSASALSYEYGTTVTFEELIQAWGVDVDTIGGWEARVYSVRIGDIIIEFDETVTEYTFIDHAPHQFTFGIVTEEGQSIKGVAKVTVQETDDSARRFCEENYIETHGYEQLLYRDGVLSAQMAAGTYKGYFADADLPYIAFTKGDDADKHFTTQSYVSVDFTGKNIPQTAFFCDTVTSDLYDKNQGIYISHGTVTTDGGEKLTGDHSCLTYFGPIKMKEKHVNTGGSFGREGWASNPHPTSRVGLQDGVHYRYIVGYSDAVAGTADSNGYLTLRMLLVNLDTKEIVVDMTKELDGNSQTGKLESKHFEGKIVLYANYGVTTKWDNIRLVEENVLDIYELYPTIEFNSNAPEYAIKGDDLNPTDYVSEEMLANGSLFYSYKADEYAAEGQLTPFTTTLSVSKAGAYRITYVPNDEKINARSMMVYANESLTLDFEDGVHNAIQGDFRAGAYLETEKPLSGTASAKVTVGPVLGLNWSDWGVDLEYLAKVFADNSVDSVVLKMKSDADVYAPMSYQSGFDGGKVAYNGGTTVFKANETTFVTITRKNFEAAKADTAGKGKYMFRFYANGAGINQFNLLIDDVSAGKVHPDGSFYYKAGLDTSYIFDGTVSEFYLNDVRYTPDQANSGVKIEGNKVTVSAALLEGITDKVQFVAKTSIGMEIANQTPISSVSTSILCYGEDDGRNSGSKIAFDVIGTVQSVKVGSVVIPFKQIGTELSFYKSDLIPYANGNAHAVTIVTKPETGANISFDLAFTATKAQIPTFETGDEILPFTTENMGEATRVENTGMKNVTVSGGVVTEKTDATGSSYKIELPDIGEGLHKITIPLTYLEEIFAIPYVDVYRFYVALSYGKSGVYLSDGFATSFLEQGFCVRAINRSNFEALQASGKDYVLTLDAASHAGSVEYMYLDNFHILGTWSTTYMEYEYSEITQHGLTLDGFYGNVATIVNNQDKTINLAADFTITGNSITLLPAKYADYKSKRIYVTTDQGVNYIIEIRIAGLPVA